MSDMVSALKTVRHSESVLSVDYVAKMSPYLHYWAMILLWDFIKNS